MASRFGFAALVGIVVCSATLCIASVQTVSPYGRGAAACPITSTNIIGDISSRDGILFGEIHGTNEIPELVGDAVCEASSEGPTLLLLELPIAYNDVIEKFMVEPNQSHAFFMMQKAGFGGPGKVDGRESIAMFRLLNRTRLMALNGRDIRVKAIDPFKVDERNPFTRDQQMAHEIVRVMSENRGSFALGLMGDVHVRHEPVTLGEETIKPTGMYLGPFRFFALYRANIKGTTWACIQERCGYNALGGPKNAPPKGIRMFGEIRQGFDGVFSVGRNYTASAPLGSR
jgi:hypothetical protein